MSKYLSPANVSTWPTLFSANAYSCFANNAAIMPNPNSFNKAAGNFAIKSGNNVLCVARFNDPLKNVDHMLKVFRLILDELQDATLTLVGRFDLNMIIPESEPITVQELLDKTGINSNVHFIGETDNISEYYKKAKVLALPSRTEGFPLVLNEAAQHGVPTVIYEIPGIEDIITDSINGYIVPQNDIQKMAKKIISILKDNNLLKELSENAISMSTRYDQSIICERWDKLLTLLLLTDDQDEINRQLTDRFFEKPRDMDKFAKTLSREYDDLLNKYYNEYSGKVETITEYVYIDQKRAFDKLRFNIPVRLYRAIKRYGLVGFWKVFWQRIIKVR